MTLSIRSARPLRARGPSARSSLGALALVLALVPAPTALAWPDAGVTVPDACGPDGGASAHIDPQREQVLPDPITVPVARVHPVCSASPQAATGEPIAWLAMLGAVLALRAVRRSGLQRKTV